MQKTQFKGVFLLLLTAFIWGVAFVAQSEGMEHVDAFSFSGIRMIFGVCVLLPFIIIRDKMQNKKLPDDKKIKLFDKKLLVCGGLLGVVFFFACNLQQFAFYYTGAGKIAFITALYMFFVPLFGLFFKKRVPWLTWVCVAFGFVGLWFLCIDPANLGGINVGDLLAMGCAVFFAVQILMIEKFAQQIDGVKLSCMQFLVAGTMSCICMFVFENPSLPAIGNAIVPLLYAGVMSCGIAYTLQIVGQKYTESTIASLIMCMESVFAVLASALLLNEVMTTREVIGCVVMFVAIILSQLSEMKFTNKK
ncbi:MAG: DMT family transporter [Clostridia bacterium]|nr:DMT family transporter [Clostridia bacterium]